MSAPAIPPEPPDHELGCATRYDAVIHHQGGSHVWARLDGLTALAWGRKLDDASQASVTVAKTQASQQCQRLLGGVQTWAHELSIYRDRRLVWQGPITQVDETRSAFVVDARDMLAWLDRRALHPLGPTSLPSWRWHYHWWEARPAGEIVGKILDDAFSGQPAFGVAGQNLLHDPGLLEHARLDRNGPLATTDLMYNDTDYCGPIIREVIDTGMDLFTIARKVYCVAEDYRLTRSPYRLGQHHFLDELTVRKLGLDLATRGICVGGNALDAEGNPMPDFPPAVTGQPSLDHPPVRAASGWDEPAYGLVEKIVESDNTVQPEVAANIAGKVRAQGYPPPAALIVPDGARLDPSAPVSVGQMVPGRMWHVELSDYTTPVAGLFRLSELDVAWDADETEQVAVSLVTAPEGATP